MREVTTARIDWRKEKSREAGRCESFPCTLTLPPGFIATGDGAADRDFRSASLRSTPSGGANGQDFLAWTEGSSPESDGKEKKAKKGKGFGSIFRSSKKSRSDS